MSWRCRLSAENCVKDHHRPPRQELSGRGMSSRGVAEAGQRGGPGKAKAVLSDGQAEGRPLSSTQLPSGGPGDLRSKADTFQDLSD